MGLLGKRITLDANSKVIIALISLSVGLWTAHRLGWMQIELDLLKPGEVEEVWPITGGHAKADVIQSGSAYGVDCRLADMQGYSLCGVGFILGPSSAQGKDLSSFHTIVLNVAYQAPLDKPRVRVSLRNYHQHYSRPDDNVSLKYNSIVYAPSQHSAEISVPLSAFHVESWWVEQNNIDFSDAKLDFTNVPFIEIISNSMPNAGRYIIEVKHAKLYGEIVSEGNLLKLLLVFWLIVIIYLISQQRDRLKTISSTDALTGLLNRRGLNEWVSQSKDYFAKNGTFAMYYFDIDDFKKVNDTYGHLVGDELLCAFCEKTQKVVEQEFKGQFQFAFSRLAGDEFALIVKDMTLESTPPVAKRIMGALSKPLPLSSHAVKLNVSLGIACSEASPKAFDDLMMRADSAMYLAKKHGKNQFRVFDDSAVAEVFFRKQVAERLKDAIANDDFLLLFMPIYDSQHLSVVGCEVLIRCTAENLKGVGPNQFIPIAEQYDLVQKLDLWVLESALKTITEHGDMLAKHPLKFCINISALELHNRYFAKSVHNLIKKYAADPAMLELEVTETSLVEVDEISISVLQELKSIGLSIALDDFGTGYTAFSQLIRYPVDCLKIDRSFIDHLNEQNEAPRTTINAILSIAKSYKLKTVAEGIESQAQLDYLQRHGCDMYQGYFFSKPVCWQTLLELCEIEQ